MFFTVSAVSLIVLVPQFTSEGTCFARTRVSHLVRSTLVVVTAGSRQDKRTDTHFYVIACSRCQVKCGDKIYAIEKYLTRRGAEPRSHHPSDALHTWSQQQLHAMKKNVALITWRRVLLMDRHRLERCQRACFGCAFKSIARASTITSKTSVFG